MCSTPSVENNQHKNRATKRYMTILKGAPVLTYKRPTHLLWQPPLFLRDGKNLLKAVVTAFRRFNAKISRFNYTFTSHCSLCLIQPMSAINFIRVRQDYLTLNGNLTLRLSAQYFHKSATSIKYLFFWHTHCQWNF